MGEGSEVTKFEQVHVVGRCGVLWEVITWRPPHLEHTDTTENITFPQTTYAGGNKAKNVIIYPDWHVGKAGLFVVVFLPIRTNFRVIRSATIVGVHYDHFSVVGTVQCH